MGTCGRSRSWDGHSETETLAERPMRGAPFHPDPTLL